MQAASAAGKTNPPAAGTEHHVDGDVVARWVWLSSWDATSVEVAAMLFRGLAVHGPGLACWVTG